MVKGGEREKVGMVRRQRKCKKNFPNLKKKGKDNWQAEGTRRVKRAAQVKEKRGEREN